MAIVDNEYSIAAVSNVLRDEICSIIAIEEAGRFPAADQVSVRDRRLVVRAVFSFIESLSHVMKVNALKVIPPASLLPGDEMTARETAFELADNGVVREKVAKLRTIANVRFSFRFFTRAHRSNFALDFSSRGWQCILRSQKVRDRLAHPKKLSDLHVTDEEYSESVRAFIWFDRQVLRALEAAIAASNARTKALDEQIIAAGGPAPPIVEEPISPPRPIGVDDDV